MVQIVVPILVFAVPVLVVVGLALVCGRRLRGSCGGVEPDGSCSRCGKPAACSTRGEDRRATEAGR